MRADGVDDDIVVIVVPNDHEVTVELSALDHAGSEGRAFAGGISPKRTAKESAPHLSGQAVTSIKRSSYNATWGPPGNPAC